MILTFENYAVTAVSEGIQCRGDFYHPNGRTLFHVCINGPEVVNDLNQQALVSHGLNWYINKAGAECPVRVGDRITVSVLLEGHWDGYSKQMRNDLAVIINDKD